MICWVRVINRRGLRALRGRPLMIISNHKAYWDVPVYFQHIHREIFFTAKPNLHRTPLRKWFFESLNSIPITEGNEIAMIKGCLSVLKKNKAIIMFPEGMIVFNEEDALAFRNGPTMIAMRAGATILPCVINKKPGLFRYVKIKIGKPISTEEFAGKKASREEITAMSDKVAGIMAEMQSGFEKWRRRERWDLEPIHTVHCIILRTNEQGIDEILVQENSFPNVVLEDNENARAAITRQIPIDTGVTIQPFKITYKQRDSDGNMHAFFICHYKTGDFAETHSSELAWIPVTNLESVALHHPSIQKQLLKDYKKKGKRIGFRVRLIK